MNGKESVCLFIQSFLLLCSVQFLDTCNLEISEDLYYGHSATIGCYMQNLRHHQEIKWYRGIEIIARCNGSGCTIANWERRHYKIIRGDNKSIVHIKSLRKEDAVKWNCKIALFNCYGTIKQELVKQGGLYVHPLSGSVLLYDSYVLQCTTESFDEPMSWVNGNGTELVSCDKPKSCSSYSSPDGRFSYNSIQQGIVIWIHSLHPDKDEMFYCSKRRTQFRYIIDYKIAIAWGAQFTKVKIEKIDKRVRCLCTIPGNRIEPHIRFILHNEEGSKQEQGSEHEIQETSCFISNCTYISYYLKKINNKTPPMSCSCGVEGKTWVFYSDVIDFSKGDCLLGNTGRRNNSKKEKVLQIYLGRLPVMVPKLFIVIAIIILICSYCDIGRLIWKGLVRDFFLPLWDFLKRKYAQKRQS